MPQSKDLLAQAPSVPTDRAGLSALRAQRDELREQLESTTAWRGRLVQERHNAAATNNLTVVRELDGRIAELGQRSQQLERDLLQADDAISAAIANGVGRRSPGEVTVEMPPMPPMPRVISIPPFERRMPNDRFMGLLVGEALLFVLLGIILWRTAFKRGARKAQVVSASPDVRQLQQSVDAIALEVERISENQRFVTRLLNENAVPVESRNAGSGGGASGR